MDRGDSVPTCEHETETTNRLKWLAKPDNGWLPAPDRRSLSGVVAPQKIFCHRLPMQRVGKREFSVIVERDGDGYYVASVPELPGCHTQARSLAKLIKRVREVIELCLEVEQEGQPTTEFVGVQRVTV